MKANLRKLTLVVLSLLCVFVLTGCEEMTTTETVYETTVIACERGTFRPNQAYQTMATKALAENDFTKYNYYKNLANALGKYDHHITVEIEGETITFIRTESYEVGQTISVKKVDYYSNGKYEKTEYR